MMIAGGLNQEDTIQELGNSGITVSVEPKGATAFVTVKAENPNDFVISNSFIVGSNQFSFLDGYAVVEVRPNTGISVQTERQIGGGRFPGKVKLDGDTGQWSIDWTASLGSMQI